MEEQGLEISRCCFGPHKGLAVQIERKGHHYNHYFKSLKIFWISKGLEKIPLQDIKIDFY